MKTKEFKNTFGEVICEQIDSNPNPWDAHTYIVNLHTYDGISPESRIEYHHQSEAVAMYQFYINWLTESEGTINKHKEA